MSAAPGQFFGWRLCAVPRWTRLALMFALLLAAATRLLGLAFVQFATDEATALQRATEIRMGLALPLVGPASSFSSPHPPFFYYFLVFPLLISPLPEWVTGFIGLLNVLAILVFSWMMISFWDEATGTTTALLFAVSPWAVFFSRKIWENDIMPFFLVLSMALLWQAVLRERPKLLIPSLGLFALATQLHLSTFAVAPVWLIALLAPGQRRQRLLFFSVGLLTATLVYLPYLLWQVQNGWPILRQSPGLGGQWSWQAFEMVRDLAVNQPYTGMVHLGAFEWLANAWDLLRWLLGLAFVVGVARLGRAVLRNPAWRWQALFLLAWLVLPVLAALRPGLPLFQHYFIAFIPAGVATIAIGLQPPQWRIADSAARLVRWGSAALAVVTVLLGTALFAAFLQAVEHDQTTPAYGPPLAATRQAIALAENAVTQQQARLYVAGDDGALPVYQVLLAGDGVPFSPVDGRRYLAFPGRGTAIYLVTDDRAAMTPILLNAFQGRTLAAFQPTIDPWAIRVVQVPANSLAQALAQPGIRRVDHSFDNGLELVAGQIKAGRSQADIWLYWRVDGKTAEPAPQVFNHLLDASGNRVAQVDGPTFPLEPWREEDTLLTIFHMDMPATIHGPETLLTGLYRLDTMQRISLRGGGDSVELGPLDLGAPGGG